MKGKLVCLLVVALSFLAFFGNISVAQAAESKTLLWGLTASLSGAGAYWGVGIVNGAKLAIEDINAKGGITVKGEKYIFDVKSYDHEFRPDKNLELMHRLIESDKAAFLWTHGAAATVACLPYFAQAKKVVVHIATGEKMLMDKEGSYYCFKTLDDPPVTTKLGFQFINQKYPHVKKVFDISPDNESGWDNSKHTKKYAEQYGIEVRTEYYPRGTTDFYPIITRGLAWNPDLITPSRSAPEVLGNILKQSRELGFKGLFYSEAPYAFEAVKKSAGQHVEGWIFVTSSYLVPGSETPEEKDFQKKYTERHGGPFNDAAQTTAQGLYIVADTIQKSQSLETDKLVQAMEMTKFKPLGRELSFVGKSIYPYKRQSNTGVVVVEVKNGEQKPISPVIYLSDDF
jgi:branched-chain amino acid transport system substrate-binding protein